MSRLVYLTLPALALLYVSLYVATGFWAIASFVVAQALLVTIIVVILKAGLRQGVEPVGGSPGPPNDATEDESARA